MTSKSELSETKLNQAALRRLLDQPVHWSMINYAAQAASTVIPCDSIEIFSKVSETRYPWESAERKVPHYSNSFPTLEAFIATLVFSSKTQLLTLAGALVYLRRLRSRLPPTAKGYRCAIHQLFMSSLILAAKYLNDSSPLNKHWAYYSTMNTQSGGFSISCIEINSMERQMLRLLNWDLKVSVEDLCRELDPFLSSIRTGMLNNSIEAGDVNRTKHIGGTSI